MNTEPETSPRPSKNLLGKKICLSGLDNTHRQFANTLEETFQDKFHAYLINVNKHVNNRQRKYDN